MLPRVIIHNATSLDGRILGFPADLGAYYGLAAGFAEDATLVGSQTVLAAPAEGGPDEERTDPGSTKQDAGDDRPLLVIPDSRGRIRNWRQLLRQPYWRAGVALCSRRTPREHLAYLEETGVAAIAAGDVRVDLRAALEELNARFGVETVRVDSGGLLNGALLRAGLASAVSLLIHPWLVGGVSPLTIFDSHGEAEADSAIALRLDHLEKLDGDLVWLRYTITG